MVRYVFPGGGSPLAGWVCSWVCDNFPMVKQPAEPKDPKILQLAASTKSEGRRQKKIVPGIEDE
jgi:hypothetical protein